jgi:hypothetical protein
MAAWNWGEFCPVAGRAAGGAGTAAGAWATGAAGAAAAGGASALLAGPLIVTPGKPV